MQKAMNRIFTLILALSLVAGGTVTMPGYASADSAPETGPPQGPDESTGDPDIPDGKTSMPKPGPSRGASNPGFRSVTAERAGMHGKWMWSFRVAFLTVYRTFFRF